MKLMMYVHNRSEAGPAAPFIEVARMMGVELTVCDRSSFTERPDPAILPDTIKQEAPDVVMAPFDRHEQVLVADAAYHLGIPVAQMFAGDLAGGAYDDADRFVISNYATYLFCADYAQYHRTVSSQKWAAEIHWKKRIEIVGATHYDNMDHEHRGETGHTLVLYNPPSTLSRGEIVNEIYDIKELFEKDERVLWVAPNGDRNSDIVEEHAKEFEMLPKMSRYEFLGWLKGAKRLVGNSSSAYYEAPYFEVPIVQVGVRNKYREPISNFMIRSGASRNIIEVLKEELE